MQIAVIKYPSLRCQYSEDSNQLRFKSASSCTACTLQARLCRKTWCWLILAPAQDSMVTLLRCLCYSVITVS